MLFLETYKDSDFRLSLVFSSQSAVDGFHERVDLGRVVAVEVVGVDGPHEGAGEVHVVGKLTLKEAWRLYGDRQKSGSQVA